MLYWRNDALKTILFNIMLFSGLGFIFFLVSCFSLFKPSMDLNTMMTEDFKSGTAVYSDLMWTYGCPVEEYSENSSGVQRTTFYYYLIPVGEYEYTLFKVPPKFYSEFERLTDETFDCWEDENAPLPTPIYIEGKIQPMDQESLPYTYDYLLQMGYTAEETEQLVIPYMVEYTNWAGVKTGAIVAGIIFAVSTPLFILYVKNKKKKLLEQAMNEEMQQNPAAGYGEYNQPVNSNSGQPVYTGVPQNSAGYGQQSYDNTQNNSSDIRYDSTDYDQKPPCEL